MERRYVFSWRLCRRALRYGNLCADVASSIFLALGDFIAPMVPIGLGLGRITNFIGQELWGRETDHPWGMVFPNDPDGLIRHPSQLYEAFFEGLVLFVIIYLLSLKVRAKGFLSAVFLVGYGSVRFAVEFLREPDAHIQYDLLGWVTRGQILCVPMVLAGLIIFYQLWRNNQNNTGLTNGKAFINTTN